MACWKGQVLCSVLETSRLVDFQCQLNAFARQLVVGGADCALVLAVVLAGSCVHNNKPVAVRPTRLGVNSLRTILSYEGAAWPNPANFDCVFDGRAIEDVNVLISQVWPAAQLDVPNLQELLILSSAKHLTAAAASARLSATTAQSVRSIGERTASQLVRQVAL